MNKIKVDGYYIYAKTFAESAITQNVSFEEFVYSLDAFSNKSVSSKPQIIKWREEALDIFLKDVKQLPQKLFSSGSDFIDESETTLVSNKQNK